MQSGIKVSSQTEVYEFSFNFQILIPSPLPMYLMLASFFLSRCRRQSEINYSVSVPQKSDFFNFVYMQNIIFD